MTGGRYVPCPVCGAGNRAADSACHACGSALAPRAPVALDDELERANRGLRWWFHLAVFLLAAFMAVPYFTRPSHYGVLEYAILPFHEAGHYFLMPFAPEFLVVLGGSLVQIGLPLGFALYFLLQRREPFSALVAAFWLCASTQAMAIYMKDARFLLLPLFGADPTDGHDWNYLFGKMGLLHRSVEIGDAFQLLGRLGMVAVLAGMAWWLVRTRRGPTATAAGPLASGDATPD